MTPTAVHQVVPSLEYGDAVSNYAVLIRRLLVERGVESRIFTDLVHPKMRRFATPLSRLPTYDSPDAAFILHYSDATRALEMLAEARGTVGLIYHNVTPSHYVQVLGGDAVSAAYMAREKLRAFLDVPRVLMADSAFNAADLQEMGARSVGVLPLAIDFNLFDQPPLKQAMRALREGPEVNFIVVGRVAPHKKIEDVIKVFYYYQNYLNPCSRLFVVGDGTATSPYVHQLKTLVEDLAIPNIYFTGKVRFRELLSYYRAADVYLCMSEHEGFCVPIVEAMYLGLPVIAYQGTAVSETMGDAGILATSKRPDVIAEMAELLIHEQQFRDRIVEKQRERAADFHVDRLRTNLARFLSAMAA